MNYPSYIDLLEFFAVEPNVEDEVHTYQAQDSSGITLSFSFNASDDSVQTVVKQDGRIVSLTSHECLTRMWIDGTMLRAEFKSDDYRITLSLIIRPFVRIEWSGLRTR